MRRSRRSSDRGPAVASALGTDNIPSPGCGHPPRRSRASGRLGEQRSDRRHLRAPAGRRRAGRSRAGRCRRSPSAALQPGSSATRHEAELVVDPHARARDRLGAERAGSSAVRRSAIRSSAARHAVARPTAGATRRARPRRAAGRRGRRQRAGSSASSRDDRAVRARRRSRPRSSATGTRALSSVMVDLRAVPAATQLDLRVGHGRQRLQPVTQRARVDGSRLGATLAVSRISWIAAGGVYASPRPCDQRR